MELTSSIKKYLKDLFVGNCYKNHELQLQVICKKLGLNFVEAEFINPKVSGMIFAKNSVYTIYVNYKHSVNRKRFTTAHEIGHYISAQCDSYSKVQLSQNGFKDYAVSFRAESNCSIAETEANEIAAEMLMPEQWVKQFLNDGLSVEQMAEKFFVSVVAMTIRIERLVYNSGTYFL